MGTKTGTRAPLVSIFTLKLLNLLTKKIRGGGESGIRTRGRL